MPFTINSFRTAIQKRGGIARPNLFEVNIVGPATTRFNVAFPIQCKVASIPPSTMGVIEVQYFGRIIKIPGNRTFDNLSVTVINDEKMIIRDGIEDWMAKMNSHIGNRQSATIEQLQADITLVHYAVDQKPIGQPWTFVDAFPVSLSEIGLDWGTNDTAEEFTIDFAYDYWKRGGAGGARGNPRSRSG